MGTKLALCCPAAFQFPACAAGALLTPLSPAPDHQAFHNAPPVPGPAVGLSQPHHPLSPQYQTTHPAPNRPRHAEGRTGALAPRVVWGEGADSRTHTRVPVLRDMGRASAGCSAQPVAVAGEATELSAITMHHQDPWPLTLITTIKACIQNLPAVRQRSARGQQSCSGLQPPIFPRTETSPCLACTTHPHRDSSTLTCATVPPIPCIHT